MSRKREKPYFSQHPESSSLSKRRRTKATPFRSKPEPSSIEEHEDLNRGGGGAAAAAKKSPSAVVVVAGIPSACSVLKLKSRFEMYGCVSRLRIDRGAGYVTFRSKDAAEAAIAASLDPLLGIEVDSQLVQVSWANDPLPQWKEGVGLSSKDVRSSSRLLRPELPLSKYGRENKLAASLSSPRQGLHNPFKGREIVAYDDIL